MLPEPSRSSHGLSGLDLSDAQTNCLVLVTDPAVVSTMLTFLLNPS